MHKPGETGERVVRSLIRAECLTLERGVLHLLGKESPYFPALKEGSPGADQRRTILEERTWDTDN